MMAWSDELLDHLSRNPLGAADIDAALRLRDSHLPATLFKFRCVDANSLASLETDQLWLSLPTEFNDPNDSEFGVNRVELVNRVLKPVARETLESAGITAIKSAAEIDAILGAEDLEQALQRALQEHAATSSGSVARELAARNARMSLAWHAVVEEKLRELHYQLRICCFSETVGSVVMWSHYGRQHHGFAVEFEVPRAPVMPSPWFTLFPVVYSDVFPNITERFFDRGQGQVVDYRSMVPACSRKSTDWAYEKEWRLVLANGGTRDARMVRLTTPVRVYLGAQMDDSERTVVMSIARRRSIKVMQMEKARNQFLMVSREA